MGDDLRNGFHFQFTEFGIEGVVPLELLPPELRSKYQAKPNDKSKRAKKDDTKGSVPPSEDNQVIIPAYLFSLVLTMVPMLVAMRVIQLLCS